MWCLEGVDFDIVWLLGFDKRNEQGPGQSIFPTGRESVKHLLYRRFCTKSSCPSVVARMAPIISRECHVLLPKHQNNYIGTDLMSRLSVFSTKYAPSAGRRGARPGRGGAGGPGGAGGEAN